MGLRRAIHTLFCLFLALVATGAAYLWSERYYRNTEVARGLEWARQVASQLDALTLHAREKGESDPLNWAVGVLTQGPEPRMMRLYKIETGASTQASETYSYETTTGAFDFSKILQPEAGRGVRIVLQLGYLGFLGTKTKAMSDLLALVMFGLTYFAFFFLGVWIFGLAGERRLKSLISSWVSRARLILNQFGAHIRELLRGEQMLMKSASECNELLHELETKIQDKLVDVQELQRGHLMQIELSKRMETLTLSAVIESSRLGAGGKRVAEIVEEVHRLVLRDQEILKTGGASLEATATSLEHWTGDVRGAAQKMVTIFGATQAIHAQLQGTTGAVMDQAKLMKALNLQLANEFPTKLRTKLDDKGESGEGESHA